MKFTPSIGKLQRELRTSDPLFERSLFVPPGNLETYAAFGRGTKEKIWSRAKGKCEITGWSHVPRETAHMSHRRDEFYNEPENGLLVADIVHLAHHVYFVNEPELIGLDKGGNNWAIDQIAERVLNWRVRRGVWPQMSYEEERVRLKKEVQPLLELWKVYYTSALQES